MTDAKPAAPSIPDSERFEIVPAWCIRDRVFVDAGEFFMTREGAEHRLKVVNKLVEEKKQFFAGLRP